MTRGLWNETSAVDLGGQISAVRNCLLIKMMHPPSKLWKKGLSEALSWPKGTLLSGEHPLHDYVLTKVIHKRVIQDSPVKHREEVTTGLYL
jgi:hypothetical protein